MPDQAGFSVLLVTGDDARKYLQGQLSNDVTRLAREQALLASLLSPQGRGQSIMTLVERPEGICALVPTAVLELTRARLGRFVIGLSIEVATAPDWGSVALSAESARQLAGTPPETPGACSSSGGVTLLRWWGADPRFVAFGPRVALPAPEPASGDFHLADIRAGLPEIHARTSDSFVPQMLNLDVLNAVSYTKGCYVGQEVVARARRAGVRRRMQRFGAACPPPVPGTRVTRGESDAGEVVGAAVCEAGCEILAVVDVAREPLGLGLSGMAGPTLTPLVLPYATGSSSGAVEPRARLSARDAPRG